MSQKRAIIIGVLGQDGSFLAELLHSKGYMVCGIVKPGTYLGRISSIKESVPGIEIYSANILDKLLLRGIIKEFNPYEIYNFAGVSNVFNPYENLGELIDLNCKAVANILESIISFNSNIRFFQSSSCLTFGLDKSGLQDENTPYAPLYPYAHSKVFADNLIKEYHDKYDIFACSGIFFNHESERRHEHFFSRKVTSTIARIIDGSKEKLKVGNLSSFRDYGYAKDYVEAAYLMLQAESPTNYVIGSGILTSLSDFLEKAFKQVGLDYTLNIEYDAQLSRPVDTQVLKANISKIKSDLSWMPKTSVDEMIKIMINHDLKVVQTKKQIPC